MKKLLLLGLFILASLGASSAQSTQCLINSVWTPCSSAPQPQFAQAAVSSKSTGSVASINAAYGSNTVKGNTLVVVFANGNNNNPTAPITDTLSLTWFKAVQVANSTAFETEIWFAPNTVGGADTVTVTPGGANASIAMTIYEIPGLFYPAATSSPTGIQSLGQTTSGTVTAGTSPTLTVSPGGPNEYVFAGFGLGTAAQTITVASPFSNDSTQQNPTTPAGLFSFVSASYLAPDMAMLSPSATATSEPWAVAVATFRTIKMPVSGTVKSAIIPLTGVPRYSASTSFAGSSTTDNFVLPGNASNTVYVTRVVVTCTQTTAGTVHFSLVKRSAADTGGTSGAVTTAPWDSNFPAAVSLPLSYTGTGPTQGAAVANIADAFTGCNATATAGANGVFIWTGAPGALTLRGTAQQLALTAGGAITGGNLTVQVDWIETTQALP